MIIGVDEVGRGAWAGPLVVGAVMLGKPVAGLADSKLLSKMQRADLDILIRESAGFIGLGWVSAGEVDELGLTKALKLGCERALMGAPDCEIIIDGNINFLSNNPRSSSLIKADQTVPAVSAASIVAKVARDNFMAEQAIIHPNYGFEKHVGYGTAVHKQAILDFGVNILHRKSYKPVKLYGAA